MFGKLLATAIFKVAGWKQVGGLDPKVKKCIMVAAPHTSNWDFIFARGAFFYGIFSIFEKNQKGGPL